MITTTAPPSYDPPLLANWLVDALREDGNPQPARISMPLQIQHLAFANIELGRRLKEALLIAMLEWQPAHGLTLLSNLARTAAYVRASRVVPLLYGILNSGRVDSYLQVNDEHERNHQHISLIIGTIGGFAPDASARTAAANLFVDRRFRQTFAPQLVTTLVRCDMDNYPKHVEQLLNMEADGEPLADMIGVTRELVRILTPATIVNQLHRFSVASHHRFCDLLGGYPNSPGRWFSGTSFLLQAIPQERYAAVAYEPDDNTYASNVCDVIDQRISRQGGIRTVMHIVKPGA